MTAPLTAQELAHEQILVAMVTLAKKAFENGHSLLGLRLAELYARTINEGYPAGAAPPSNPRVPYVEPGTEA